MQLAALNEGTKDAREAARLHAEDVLTPLRDQIKKMQKPLLLSAINVDYFKSMPAMLGMMLLNGFSIPTLLAGFGADSSQIEELVGDAAGLFTELFNR